MTNLEMQIAEMLGRLVSQHARLILFTENHGEDTDRRLRIGVTFRNNDPGERPGMSEEEAVEQAMLFCAKYLEEIRSRPPGEVRERMIQHVEEEIGLAGAMRKASMTMTQFAQAAIGSPINEDVKAKIKAEIMEFYKSGK